MRNAVVIFHLYDRRICYALTSSAFGVGAHMCNTHIIRVILLCCPASAMSGVCVHSSSVASSLFSRSFIHSTIRFTDQLRKEDEEQTLRRQGNCRATNEEEKMMFLAELSFW